MPDAARLLKTDEAGGGAAAPIRVMLVDDSIVVRSILTRVIEAHPDFAVVASASTADHALAMVDTIDVDVILLDLEMPGTDGLTALPELLRRSRGARVLIVAAAVADGGHAAVRALTLGAADTLPKPSASAYGSRFNDRLIAKLLRVGRAAPPAVLSSAADVARATGGTELPLRGLVEGPLQCIAIGSSTGGVNALAELFAAMPATCDAPVLITQHLPAAFMPFFAAQLTSLAKRPTKVAADGARLQRGEILLAPGDAHIGLLRTPGFVRIELDHRPSASGARPSVDPMFEAVADCFGSDAVGVVLSGMGRDGVLGAKRLAEVGAEILIQDEASCVIWGMPGVVARAGLASIAASPRGIAARLGQRHAAAPPRTAS